MSFKILLTVKGKSYVKCRNGCVGKSGMMQTPRTPSLSAACLVPYFSLPKLATMQWFLSYITVSTQKSSLPKLEALYTYR